MFEMTPFLALLIGSEQKQSVTRRTDAIVEATIAFKEVAAAMIASLILKYKSCMYLIQNEDF